MKYNQYDINSVYKIEKSKYITTPLNASVLNDNTTISELLLKIPNIDVNSKSIDIESHKTRTSLFYAFKNQNFKIFKLLLENEQIDVNMSNTKFEGDGGNYYYCEGTILIEAVNYNDYKIIELFKNSFQY